MPIVFFQGNLKMLLLQQAVFRGDPFAVPSMVSQYVGCCRVRICPWGEPTGCVVLPDCCVSAQSTAFPVTLYYDSALYSSQHINFLTSFYFFCPLTRPVLDAHTVPGEDHQNTLPAKQGQVPTSHLPDL